MPNSDGFPRPFERPGAGWLGRPLWKSSQIWSWRESGPRKQVAVLDRICFWLPTPRNCVETVILDAGPRDLLMPFTLSFFKMILINYSKYFKNEAPSGSQERIAFWRHRKEIVLYLFLKSFWGTFGKKSDLKKIGHNGLWLGGQDLKEFEKTKRFNPFMVGCPQGRPWDSGWWMEIDNSAHHLTVRKEKSMKVDCLA